MLTFQLDALVILRTLENLLEMWYMGTYLGVGAYLVNIIVVNNCCIVYFFSFSCVA